MLDGDVVIETTAGIIILYSGVVITRSWFTNNSNLPFEGIRAGDILHADGFRIGYGSKRRSSKSMLVLKVDVDMADYDRSIWLALSGFDSAKSISSLETDGSLYFKQDV